MSHWAPNRSFGCFIYFDREVPARALLEEAATGLGITDEAKISTRNRYLSWKKLRWKAVDDAIESSTTLSITLLVGTPQDVRLGGRITLRMDPRWAEDRDDGAAWPPSTPPLVWLGAESGRWPESVFRPVARNLLRIAATSGTALSGGVFAQSDLRNAKIEMTDEFESDWNEEPDKSPHSFWGRMMAERPMHEVRTKIRRVYPTTLLGPKFASQVDADKLAAAGATNIEHINGSVLFDATPELHEAWSPEYLDATVELRRLLWPLSFQNPADDPDPPRKQRR